MLKVEHLTLSIGGTALLDDVGFVIADGERVGLNGASGSGKSLLVAALLGVLPRDAVLAGQIGLDPAGARVGVLSPRSREGLLPLVTVRAQLG